MLSVMILEMILLLRGKQAASLRAWEIWLTSVTKVRALYHANKFPRYFLSIVYHIVVASELAGFTILIHDLSNSSDCNLHPRAQFFGLILFGLVPPVITAMKPIDKIDVELAAEFSKS